MSVAVSDNVDYRLLPHWRAQRWPALYEAAAEAELEQLEERMADLLARLERHPATRARVVTRFADDDR